MATNLELTKLGPGKYSLAVDAYTHSLTMDGGCDESGSVDEGGWHGLVDGPIEPTHEDIAEFGLSADDIAWFFDVVGAIVAENSNGFVDVEYYTSSADLARDWDSIVSADIRPEEDDITTEDGRTFYQSGKRILTVPDGADASEAIAAYCESQQYWPNVWSISDQHVGRNPWERVRPPTPI